MVSSVQVDIVGIDDEERKEDEEDLNGVLAPVHEVSIENIGFV